MYCRNSSCPYCRKELSINDKNDLKDKARNACKILISQNLYMRYFQDTESVAMKINNSIIKII